MPNRRLTIVLYIIAVCFFWASQYIYLPTLPTYVQLKTGSLAAVGVVLSMYGLWQALVRLPLGIAADWLGWRKPFSILGLGLAGLGAWILAASNTADGLALGRAIAGASAGAWVGIVVAFSALFPPEEAVRASSLLMIFNSLGRIIATVLGLISAMILLPIHESRRTPRVRALRISFVCWCAPMFYRHQC